MVESVVHALHMGAVADAVVQRFDDPFMLPSSDYIPHDMKSAMDFCMFLYYLNPQYRRASSRVIRHFITPFEYPGEVGSKDEKGLLDDYLEYGLRLPQKLAEVGDEWSAYGNGFVRMYFPFDRVLVDAERSTTYSLDMFRRVAKFRLNELKYEIPDPKDTSKKRLLPFRDVYVRDRGRIKIRNLDPRDINIQHNMVSGTNHFVWRIPAELRRDCKDGKLFVVNEVPLDILRAIRDEDDFLFNEDEVFHFRAPTISGNSNRGWGLPETIANYRDLHQLQVYRKIDEAVGLDYMVPFRLFSPEFSNNESSMIRNVVMSQWKAQVQSVVRERRRDKFSIHSLPFPVNYQEFGAEGKALTPKDLIEWQTNNMLDAMGYPAELFRGSLQVQQIPTAVRMFENTFLFVHQGFTDLSQWVVSKISKFMGEPEIKIRLSKPSMADNMDRQNAILQLTSAGEISRKKGFDWLGIDDPVEERRMRLEEDAEIEEASAKAQQELEHKLQAGTVTQQIDAAQQAQQQQAGGNPPGGQPTPSGQPASGATPMDIQGQAQELAANWAGMEEGERRKNMAAIKASNPTLHAVAQQMLDEQRGQARSQGV
ncbi:MAG: hypothetical protein EB168_08775, partial [Euryarchaeota archaeon]|nr:hypothetical protein [Euryarchaeota archaeon]